EQFWREVRARFEDHGVDKERPLLPPERIYLPVNELFTSLKRAPLTQLYSSADADRAGTYLLRSAGFPELDVEQKAAEPLFRLQMFLQQQSAVPILFCCDSAGRREVMLELLRRIGVAPQVVAGWQEF